MKAAVIVCALVTYTLSYPTNKEDVQIIPERLFNRYSNNFYNSKSAGEKSYDKEFEDGYDIDEYQNFNDNFEGSEYINKDNGYHNVESSSQPYQYELGYFSDQNNVNDDDGNDTKETNQDAGEIGLESSVHLSQSSNLNDKKDLKLDGTTKNENSNPSSTKVSSSKSSTDNLSSTLTTSKSIIETLKEISDLDKQNFYENKKSKELSAIHDEVDRLIKEMDDGNGDSFDTVGDIKQKADQLLDKVMGFKKQYYD
jgi:hypothetical protein